MPTAPDPLKRAVFEVAQRQKAREAAQRAADPNFSTGNSPRSKRRKNDEKNERLKRVEKCHKEQDQLKQLEDAFEADWFNYLHCRGQFKNPDKEFVRSYCKKWCCVYRWAYRELVGRWWTEDVQQVAFRHQMDGTSAGVKAPGQNQAFDIGKGKNMVDRSAHIVNHYCSFRVRLPNAPPPGASLLGQKSQCGKSCKERIYTELALPTPVHYASHTLEIPDANVLIADAGENEDKKEVEARREAFKSGYQAFAGVIQVAFHWINTFLKGGDSNWDPEHSAGSPFDLGPMVVSWGCDWASENIVCFHLVLSHLQASSLNRLTVPFVSRCDVHGYSILAEVVSHGVVALTGLSRKDWADLYWQSTMSLKRNLYKVDVLLSQQHIEVELVSPSYRNSEEYKRFAYFVKGCFGGEDAEVRADMSRMLRGVCWWVRAKPGTVYLVPDALPDLRSAGVPGPASAGGYVGRPGTDGVSPANLQKAVKTLFRQMQARIKVMSWSRWTGAGAASKRWTLCTSYRMTFSPFCDKDEVHIEGSQFANVKSVNKNAGLTLSIATLIAGQAAPDRSIKHILGGRGVDAANYHQYLEHLQTYSKELKKSLSKVTGRKFCDMLMDLLFFAHGVEGEAAEKLVGGFAAQITIGILRGMSQHKYIYGAKTADWLYRVSKALSDPRLSVDEKAKAAEKIMEECSKNEYSHSGDPRDFAVSLWTRDKFAEPAGKFVQQLQRFLLEVFVMLADTQRVLCVFFIIAVYS